MEIENLSNLHIERDLLNINEDMEQSQRKIKELESRIQSTTLSNDSRVELWHSLIESEREKIILNKKVSILYRDKISLRQHIESQNEAIEKLSQTVVNLYEKLSNEINKLKNYNMLLPSEKESRIQKELEEMTEKYEEELKVRRDMESTLQENLLDF